MESDQELLIERDIRAFCMPMEIVYEALSKVGKLGEESKKKEENKVEEGQYCQYCKRPVGHSIQDC